MKGLFAVLMLVLAALVCVPQTAEAAIFGSRSKSVVVQKQVVRPQRVVVQQQVVRQQVVRQRVVQQVVVPSYGVQQLVVPVQQLNSGCSNNGGVLQLNNGCQALYGR